jgi:hypothetical protein
MRPSAASTCSVFDALCLYRLKLSVITARSFIPYFLSSSIFIQDPYLVMRAELAFPHLTDTGPAPNPRQILARYEEVFAALAAEGTRPLVLRYCLYGIALLFVYLCIPHTQSPIIYAVRWPVLLAIISF